jgi:biopolymer transport protein ExbD
VTGITVTPLVDVLLVLFIIFLVIVPAGRRQLPVILPPDTRGGHPAPQLVLEITPSNDYLLNGQPIPHDALASVLRATFDRRPARVIFIRPAPERSYQDFISAADVARGAGASIVALVEPTRD